LGDLDPIVRGFRTDSPIVFFFERQCILVYSFSGCSHETPFSLQRCSCDRPVQSTGPGPENSPSPSLPLRRKGSIGHVFFSRGIGGRFSARGRPIRLLWPWNRELGDLPSPPVSVSRYPSSPAPSGGLASASLTVTRHSPSLALSPIACLMSLTLTFPALFPRLLLFFKRLFPFLRSCADPSSRRVPFPDLGPASFPQIHPLKMKPSSCV